MSRIFDALRKAQAGRGESPAAATPLDPVAPPPPVPAFPSTVARAATPGFPERAPEPRRGHPLAAAVTLDDDVLQQMTTLRVGLEASLTDRTCRVVLFQGPQGGEGTTTVAHQFAWALSRDRNLHTLILDANAARPTLELDGAHRVVVCRLPGVPGSGALDTEVAMNLHAVPVPEPARQSGLFAPAVAREMLESFVGGYDWIVIDGPPVLTSPEAAPLAAIADAVVVVIQAGRTKRPVLARSVELLRKAGARVAGTVLNRRRLEIPEFVYRRL